jgi:hypothetical protein
MVYLWLPKENDLIKRDGYVETYVTFNDCVITLWNLTHNKHAFKL